MSSQTDSFDSVPVPAQKFTILNHSQKCHSLKCVHDCTVRYILERLKCSRTAQQNICHNMSPRSLLYRWHLLPLSQSDWQAEDRGRKIPQRTRTIEIGSEWVLIIHLYIINETLKKQIYFKIFGPIKVFRYIGVLYKSFCTKDWGIEFLLKSLMRSMRS